MSGFHAFIKKEIIECIRSYKFLITFGLFLFLAILSIMSARFTPQLLSALAPELNIMTNVPVALDAWNQFYKNVSQVGMSAVVIIFCTSLSSEYARGTLIILLSKGLSRTSVILSKFTVAFLSMSICFWVCYIVTNLYTRFFWPNEFVDNTLFAAMLLWIAGTMYLSLLMLACVLFRQSFSSIVFFLGVTTVLGLTTFPAILGNNSPMVLTTRNIQLLTGEAARGDFIIPVIFAVSLSITFLTMAIVLFRKKQL